MLNITIAIFCDFTAGRDIHLFSKMPQFFFAFCIIAVFK